jgi:uncharacterized protein (TIGR04255 family)
MPATNDPFTGPLPAEVPLAHAPLVRVLTQIRFPEILAIEKKEFVAPFQEEIRSIYPVLRQEQGRSIIFSPEGINPGKPETAWRFGDKKNEWRLSLTPSFVSLETTKYGSRNEFIARLDVVLAALIKHVHPAMVDRIGVRYIDRVEGPAFERLSALVRPEVLGLKASNLDGTIMHCVQETAFELGPFQLLARSAVVPPNATPDPTVVEPVDGPSWLLDLDMFSTQSVPFESQAVVQQVKLLSERTYAFFRWAVTDEFLKEYGGAV